MLETACKRQYTGLYRNQDDDNLVISNGELFRLVFLKFWIAGTDRHQISTSDWLIITFVALVMALYIFC